jgi:hypothetical protein
MPAVKRQNRAFKRFSSPLEGQLRIGSDMGLWYRCSMKGCGTPSGLAIAAIFIRGNGRALQAQELWLITGSRSIEWALELLHIEPILSRYLAACKPQPHHRTKETLRLVPLLYMLGTQPLHLLLALAFGRCEGPHLTSA